MDRIVNERQKIRHYRARSMKKEEKRMPNRYFFTSRVVFVNLRYIAILYTHSIGNLKCVIVYLARDIPAFVMYYVNGESGSSLLIESTDSMIYIMYIHEILQDSTLQMIRKTIITG